MNIVGIESVLNNIYKRLQHKRSVEDLKTVSEIERLFISTWSSIIDVRQQLQQVSSFQYYCKRFGLLPSLLLLRMMVQMCGVLMNTLTLDHASSFHSMSLTFNHSCLACTFYWLLALHLVVFTLTMSVSCSVSSK